MTRKLFQKYDEETEQWLLQDIRDWPRIDDYEHEQGVLEAVLFGLFLLSLIISVLIPFGILYLGRLIITIAFPCTKNSKETEIENEPEK